MPKIIATFTKRETSVVQYDVELEFTDEQLARMERNKDAVQAAWEAQSWAVIGHTNGRYLDGTDEITLEIQWPVEVQ